MDGGETARGWMDGDDHDGVVSDRRRPWILVSNPKTSLTITILVYNPLNKMEPAHCNPAILFKLHLQSSVLRTACGGKVARDFFRFSGFTPQFNLYFTKKPATGSAPVWNAISLLRDPPESVCLSLKYIYFFFGNVTAQCVKYHGSPGQGTISTSWLK